MISRLFLSEVLAGGEAPDSPAPGDDEEDPAKPPHSQFKAVCPSSVGQSHRRTRGWERMVTRDACGLQAPCLFERVPTWPAASLAAGSDPSFLVCRLLF